MKWIGAAMILLSCSWGGFALSEEIASKTKELRNFILSLENLKAEILFHYTPLERCLQILADQGKGCAVTFYSSVFNAMQADKQLSFADNWRQHAQQMQNTLGKAGASALADLAEMLGRYDAHTQAEQIDQCLLLLEQERIKSENSLHTNGKIYRMAGVSMGIATALLIL